MDLSQELIKIAGRLRNNIPTEVLWKDYQELGNAYKVGEKHGMSAPGVIKRLRTDGYTINPHPGNPDIATEDIWKAYQELQSVRKAAKKVYLSPSGLKRRLRKAGLPLNPRKINSDSSKEKR